MDQMQQFLETLKANRYYAPQIVYHHRIPAQEGKWAREEKISPWLFKSLNNLNIKALYAHQALAIQKIRKGENVVVATPTASGKTLIYTLPVVESLLHDPKTKALYIFPLKALEQDQLKALQQFIAPLGSNLDLPMPAAIYDGDTSSYRRQKIREAIPPILITNPDMIHLSLLPFHTQWSSFFQNLKYVILDELHTYRGIFGSHLTQIMRRLGRVCEFYGSHPQFIACSATIANPQEFAEKITGLPFAAVVESGAPRSAKNFLFLNPTASPYTLAAKLFRDCLDYGLRTLAFTQARKITELLHTWILKDRPDLRTRVSSYRAGFLPEERRDIEKKLLTGELWGVISTSALELGIDIGGLDVCILVGYPGTIATTWQRGGRVGRGDQESLIALIAQPDALDQYFMRHPQDFFQRSFEKAVVDPHNSVIVAKHLICAGAEIPLRLDDGYFPLNRYLPLVEQLVAEKELLPSASGKEWFAHRLHPHRLVDIRSAGEGFSIFEEKTKRLIGQISVPRVYTECHPGAIYLHRADTYLIKNLDLGKREVWAESIEVDYYTRAQQQKETEILSVNLQKDFPRFTACYGRLKVTEKVIGFEKRRIFGQDLLQVQELDLPSYIFETMGLWIILPQEIPSLVKREGGHFMGGIHALEHAAIALFPLFALCDRNDVGGICYPVHPQLGKPAIFIYDGYPGGVGLAEYGYTFLNELLQKTQELIKTCPCLDGCPSCVHSPKCGSGNKPLDKKAAEFILHWLIQENVCAKENNQPLSPPGEQFLLVEQIKEKVVTLEQPFHPPEKLIAEISQHRILFLDLETQRSAEEVGGWHNKHLMRLAVAVIYDSQENSFTVFTEEQVHELIAKLQTAELIVGFNIFNFDYQVLRGYTSFPLGKLKTFDILEAVANCLGYRLSLNHLAHKTLQVMKTADGLQSLQWFKEGRINEVIAYCRQDVEITKNLFLFGLANGYLLFTTKNEQLVRLPVSWNLGKILAA
ncbi:MAG: DEAD/DEAH box helicase [Thermodesulfobacteriota bacterium]